MAAIYNLMNKGEANLKPGEFKKLFVITVDAESYEGVVYELKPQKGRERLLENKTPLQACK